MWKRQNKQKRGRDWPIFKKVLKLFKHSCKKRQISTFRILMRYHDWALKLNFRQKYFIAKSNKKSRSGQLKFISCKKFDA